LRLLGQVLRSLVAQVGPVGLQFVEQKLRLLIHHILLPDLLKKQVLKLSYDLRVLWIFLPVLGGHGQYLKI
jgi:hypothetical protein